MENSVKTNRLAIVSVACGLIALVAIIFVFVLYGSQESSSGIISLADGIIMPLRNLCVAIALLTGILALREIKKRDGTEKGKFFAWVGIVIGAGWLLFGLLVGIIFILSEIQY